MNWIINEERLTAQEYIEFLKKTDLGSQYPKERFEERIDTLVKKASISLVARDSADQIIGVCFGITDFAYWLFITDLGVVRECTGQGIGKALVLESGGTGLTKSERSSEKNVKSSFCRVYLVGFKLIAIFVVRLLRDLSV